MKILEVHDLCKTYGTGETAVHALNHINFLFKRRIYCHCGRIRPGKVHF